MSEAPILSLVMDRSVCRRSPAGAVEASFAGGADWLQIRERELADAAWLTWAESLVAAARRGASQRGRTARILVNRRVDLALALGADGVHLGTGALAPDEVARLFPGCRIGASVHDPLELAELAHPAGQAIHYAHLAPIYAPISKIAKPGSRPPLGAEALARAARFGIPVLAQGGVTAAHCAEVLRSGAAGVAVTGEILMSDDPAAAAAELRDALDRARG